MLIHPHVLAASSWGKLHIGWRRQKMAVQTTPAALSGKCPPTSVGTFCAGDSVKASPSTLWGTSNLFQSQPAWKQDVKGNKFLLTSSVKTSQALTCHWDFYNPHSCKDFALAWTEQSLCQQQPLPWRMFLWPGARHWRVLIPPTLVSAFLLFPHPHVTSPPWGVSRISIWLQTPTSDGSIGYQEGTFQVLLEY